MDVIKPTASVCVHYIQFICARAVGHTVNPVYCIKMTSKGLHTSRLSALKQ